MENQQEILEGDILRAAPFVLTDEMKRIYLRQAYRYAAKHSTDLSTQNGAVLWAPNMGVVAQGANHFPYGVKSTPERLQRPLKYAFTEHAERNVLFACSRKGVRTTGLIMFCPWFACADCARAIIQCGVTKVIGHKQMFDATPEHWKESIAQAFEMFTEAGTETELFDGEIGGVQVRFNGAPFSP